MATYAIGDIQGCSDSFQSLLKLIHFDSSKDQLWLAGDMVNRGPKSLETLEWIYLHRDVLKVVLGNHDLHLLFQYWGKRESKKGDTLHCILANPQAPVWIDWLSQQNFVHIHNPYLMVHAGIHPHWTLSDVVQTNQECKQALQQRKMHPCFSIFTRMRFLDLQNQVEKEFSDSPENAPPHLKPWFNEKRKIDENITILFGHWASLGIRSGPGWQSLDSGCVWGEKLTALCLEDQKIFQVDYCG